jgi:hypothetical protein
MTAVLLRGKNARSSGPGMMFQKTCKKQYGNSSKNITFSLLKEQIGKNAMMKIISNALPRFKHALNKYYVQRSMSPLNRFGYITSNEWDTFIQQHTTPEVISLINKMKELNVNNKFRHKVGPGGYKATMAKWIKKEQELRENRIPDPLEGCTVHTNGKVYLPRASYTLTNEEKRAICKCLHGIRVSTGFSINIKNLVSMSKLKMSGYNTHDYHTMLSLFLAIAIKAVNHPYLKMVITRMCHFFNAISKKVIDVIELDEIRKEIRVTMC